MRILKESYFMNIRKSAFLAGAGVLFALPAFASADINWTFNTLVSGDDPGFSAPWATLTGTNVAGGAEFVLTFSSNAPAGEFIGGLDMNYDGSLSGASFTSDHPEKVKDVSFGDFTDAGSVFNIDLNLLTTNKDGGDHRLKPGESIRFDILGAGIDVDGFNTLSDPKGDGQGYFALLHIQGLPNGGSSKVAPGAVPEPASMGALAIGALGLMRRRKRN